MAARVRKRSWRLRFSLRLLLIVITCAAVLLGIYRMQIHPYLSQQEAIAVFQEVGGSVTVETRGQIWLREMVGHERLQTIVEVDLSNCRVNDQCLHWLNHLPDLKTYRVGYQAPGMMETPQYDDGLWTAEYLNLTNCPVTDRGLRELESCQQLQTLFLINTKATDAGIVRLTRLKNVKTLWLTNTKVSDTTIDTLRQHFPESYIGN